MNNHKLNDILSFHPEIMTDWTELSVRLVDWGFKFEVLRVMELEGETVSGDECTFDVVEIKLLGASTIRHFLRHIDRALVDSDCHYIMQTVRACPIEKNNFNRRDTWEPTTADVRRIRS